MESERSFTGPLSCSFRVACLNVQRWQQDTVLSRTQSFISRPLKCAQTYTQKKEGKEKPATQLTDGRAHTCSQRRDLSCRATLTGRRPPELGLVLHALLSKISFLVFCFHCSFALSLLTLIGVYYTAPLSLPSSPPFFPPPARLRRLR